MPALPDVPSVLKVQLKWQDIADVGAMTVLHYRYTGGPPSSAQCAAMASTICAAQGTRFASLIVPGSAVEACTVTDLTTSSSGQGSGGTPTSGTRAGTMLAPATAFVISFSIPRRYRGGHPRVYLPLGASGDIVGGRWTSSVVTAVSTAWNNFNSDILAAGSGCTIVSHVNVSYVNGGARRTTPVVDVISGNTVQPIVGSQRRRNRKQ